MARALLAQHGSDSALSTAGEDSRTVPVLAGLLPDLGVGEELGEPQPGAVQ